MSTSTSTLRRLWGSLVPWFSWFLCWLFWLKVDGFLCRKSCPTCTVSVVMRLSSALILSSFPVSYRTSSNQGICRSPETRIVLFQRAKQENELCARVACLLSVKPQLRRLVILWLANEILSMLLGQGKYSGIPCCDWSTSPLDTVRHRSRSSAGGGGTSPLI